MSVKIENFVINPPTTRDGRVVSVLKKIMTTSPRELSHEFFSTGGKRIFAILKFVEHISTSFQYFVMISTW